jgi:Icc-related predicted phosphoesterase
MKIQLLSDLHIEFDEFDFPSLDSDVVVLAGDIHVKTQGLQWALKNIKTIPVIYVLGNHEYYGKTFPKLAGQLKEQAKGSNIHILEKDTITIDGVDFFGCTLWTDFNLYGNPRTTGYECQQRMTDYKKIKRLPSYSKIRSVDVAQFHNDSLHWLSEALERSNSSQKIVVSHHGPSAKSLDSSFEGDPTNAAYVSDLEPFILQSKPNYWLHGHIHCSSDYYIGDCRVLCNPRGYLGEENDDFDERFVFETEELQASKA